MLPNSVAVRKTASTLGGLSVPAKRQWVRSKKNSDGSLLGAAPRPIAVHPDHISALSERIGRGLCEKAALRRAEAAVKVC